MRKLKVFSGLFRALVWACAFTLILPTYAIVFGRPDFNVCLLKGEKEKKNEESCKGHWIFKSLGSDFSTQGVGLQGSGTCDNNGCPPFVCFSIIRSSS